jgi:crotonobetainyl-CoA:carnitine CoA-transferase CaiB-like acyl-CoA transferase
MLTTLPLRTGEPDRSPVKVGVAATDIATGLYAHGAIMAALLSRQQTGKGVWIDCNLFETQVSFLTSHTLHLFRLIAARLLASPILHPTTL